MRGRRKRAIDSDVFGAKAYLGMDYTMGHAADAVELCTLWRRHTKVDEEGLLWICIHIFQHHLLNELERVYPVKGLLRVI